MLVISLFGARGKKNEKLTFKPVIIYLIAGLILFFGSQVLLTLNQSLITTAVIYISVTTIGFVLILTGGTLCPGYSVSLRNDIFNKVNETFPQEERLLNNEYSINLPANYNLKEVS